MNTDRHQWYQINMFVDKFIQLMLYVGGGGGLIFDDPLPNEMVLLCLANYYKNE